MKPLLKINFASFWKDPVFDPHDNWFTQLLSPHYDIEISKKPDFLICSIFDYKFFKYDCIQKNSVVSHKINKFKYLR